MTIRRGADWGEVVERPPDGRAAATDAAVAAMVDEAGPGDGCVVVTGGDLLRTLGGPSVDGRLRRYTVDVLRVDVGDRPVPAIASVVARRPGRLGWWRGPLAAAMNVSRLGRWDVAPRAHPNDGLVDVVAVDAALPVRARWQAWRRLPAGAHVPHPAIAVSRTARVEWSFAERREVWVDGVSRGVVRHVVVTVEPDAATVYA